MVRLVSIQQCRMRAVEMGVAGIGCNIPDPMPAEERKPSPELSPGAHEAAHPSQGPSGENGTPGRSWLHPSCRTICYFYQRATGHKYRFLSIFHYLT